MVRVAWGLPLWVGVGALLWAPHNTAPSHRNVDRQTSERVALDARKREQFQRLKEQFVKDQEVGGMAAGGAAWGRPALTWDAVYGPLCSGAGRPGRRRWMTTSATRENSVTGSGG